MSDPDVHYRDLLQAARSVERALPPPGEHGLVCHGLRDDEAVLEFAAKAEHLAAMVYLVDGLCREGLLPSDWQAGTAAAKEPEAWLQAKGALADVWDGEPAEVTIRRINDGWDE